MKKLFYIFSSLFFLASIFLIMDNVNAAGICTCRQPVSYDACTCDIICPSMSVTLPGGGSLPLQEASCSSLPPGVRCECTTPHPFPADDPAQCTTICRDNISDPSYGTKAGAGVAEFQEAAGVDDSCDRDAECTGRGCISGGCFCVNGIEDFIIWGQTESEYRASGSRGSCDIKSSTGSPCMRNEHCSYNICDADSGKCADASGSVPTTPGEETPPQTEDEVFPTYQLKSPIGEVTGPELIGRIIKAVLGVVGALALAMFVFGGFTWLTSGGSPDKIKKGKDILMWAVIGLVVIFTSYTLVDFVLTAFGL